ncbi:hypothetical protein [Mixta intestinalis]|nr:hypothetical protein [Mixta intestinalis]
MTVRYAADSDTGGERHIVLTPLTTPGRTSLSGRIVKGVCRPGYYLCV